MDERLLNTVNEEGEVTGVATREAIHQEGLLHPEIHVWFYTPQGEVVFQHRAKDKDTWPDLLDATVGGHVEIGDTYEKTALKEALEETGVSIPLDALTFITTTITKHHDTGTGRTNHARRNVYAYRYGGALEDLRVEEGKALGFVALPFNEVLDPASPHRSKIIPSILEETGLGIIRSIQSLYENHSVR